MDGKIVAMASVIAALVFAAEGRAQSQAPSEAASAPSQSPTAGQTPPPVRLSWTSDRQPVRVGDILTVVIEEEASARERTGKTATADRGMAMSLGNGVPAAILFGPQKGFATSLGSSSRDRGEALRSGDLSAVLTVRVTELEPTGAARIVGTKKVVVDGRTQEFSLSGVVRPEDITASNVVFSSRVAEAEIVYKGKKIKPRSGILGKLLSIFWP